MKKLNYLLYAALFTIVISSCAKDDTMETPQDNTPFFKATFDWNADFLVTAGVTNASDSVPVDMNLAWDADLDINIDLDAEITTLGDIAVLYEEEEDTGYLSLTAVQVQGTDTVIFSFSIYGEIEEKDYTFAGVDLLAGIFGEEMEPPSGTIIPLLVSYKSEAALTPALMTLFGAVDFAGSSFSITKYDLENNEVSGNFNVNYKIPASDGDPELDVMQVVDGAFNRVRLIK